MDWKGNCLHRHLNWGPLDHASHRPNYVCECACKQLPSNQSFDKQISSHQKSGDVSWWGNGSKATAYNFVTCMQGVHSTMHLVDSITCKVHVTYIVYVCVYACKHLPSNQSLDKQIFSHQKGGDVSRWGEWFKGNCLQLGYVHLNWGPLDHASHSFISWTKLRCM